MRRGYWMFFQSFSIWTAFEREGGRGLARNRKDTESHNERDFGHPNEIESSSRRRKDG
jgi:hypothetical protein